jgi:hypothetical protein
VCVRWTKGQVVPKWHWPKGWVSFGQNSLRRYQKRITALTETRVEFAFGVLSELRMPT